jgi:hypothetical protein
VTTYNFTGPSEVAVRAGACPACGKRGKRQTTIEHTVNPWNRRPDGEPKTWDEVREDVRRKAAEWAAVPFAHAGCEVTA